MGYFSNFDFNAASQPYFRTPSPDLGHFESAVPITDRDNLQRRLKDRGK